MASLHFNTAKKIKSMYMQAVYIVVCLVCSTIMQEISYYKHTRNLHEQNSN